MDVHRETAGGFARGVFQLRGLGHTNARSVRVDFQNENLIARELVEDGLLVLGCVPDLLCLLETEGAVLKRIKKKKKETRL